MTGLGWVFSSVVVCVVDEWFPFFAVRWRIGHVVLVTFWYFGVVVLVGGLRRRLIDDVMAGGFGCALLGRCWGPTASSEDF